ncbi:MAG: segregation/condensation protein A [Nanoarchaeota archaeon]
MDDQPKIEVNKVEVSSTVLDSMNQDEVYGLLLDNEVGWQAILYDLINTERLDPWNLDLVALTQKYLEKVRILEEANFFISSNIILAASLLLRIKSEILLDHYIPSLDAILYGKKDEEKKSLERIHIDESQLPLIYPRSPMPRNRQVTLSELVSALSHAIKTENRRIRKELIIRSARRETDIVFPKMKIRIQDRIRQIYAKILSKFQQKKERIPYSDIASGREDRIAGFLPVLHLDNQQKVFLQQEAHYEEIYVWVYKHYKELNPHVVSAELEEVDSSEIANHEQLENFDAQEQEIIDELNKSSKLSDKTGFDNPLGNLLSESGAE